MDIINNIGKKPCNEWDENEIKTLYNISIMGPFKNVQKCADKNIIDKYYKCIDKARELILTFNLYLMESIDGKNNNYRKLINKWVKNYDISNIEK